MNDSEPTMLQCPECGSTRFSWILKQVQFGDIQRFEKDGKTHYHEIGQKMGEVVGSDVEAKGVFCTGCDEIRDRDELEVVDE